MISFFEIDIFLRFFIKFIYFSLQSSFSNIPCMYVPAIVPPLSFSLYQPMPLSLKIDFISKGDDYQILFTSSKSNRSYIKSSFKRVNQKVTLIGNLTNEIKSNQIIYNKKLLKHRYNEGYFHNFS